jgi:DnaJ-class molecular chaperone
LHLAAGDADARALYDMHGYEAASGAAGKERGPEASVELQVSLAELYTGAAKSLSIKRRVVCKGCSGAGAAATARCRACGKCPNELQNVKVQLAPGFVVNQRQEVASKERCKEASATLQAEVVAGSAEGSEIVAPRMSEQRPGTIPGDVKLKLKLKEDGGAAGRAAAAFRREGDDLHTEVELSLREALLGFNVSVSHLDGHRVLLERRSVTQPMQKLRVVGEGMPIRDATDGRTHGTLHVTLVVRNPDTLSAQAEALALALPPSSLETARAAAAAAHAAANEAAREAMAAERNVVYDGGDDDEEEDGAD